jgi:hypothetical protein
MACPHCKKLVNIPINHSLEPKAYEFTCRCGEEFTVAATLTTEQPLPVEMVSVEKCLK